MALSDCGFSDGLLFSRDLFDDKETQTLAPVVEGGKTDLDILMSINS